MGKDSFLVATMYYVASDTGFHINDQYSKNKVDMTQVQ